MLNLFKRESQQEKEGAASLASFSKALQTSGLINANCVSSAQAVPVHECGVSLNWLKRLLETLSSSHVEALTEQVVTRAFNPITAKSKKCRLFDFIPSEHQGPPTHYAIHTHGAAFQSTLKQLLAVASTSSNVGRVIFVWIDFVAISQHRQFNNVADLNLVKKVVNSCTCGSILVLDKSQHLPNRMWCQFEIWQVLKHHDVTKLLVGLPEDISIKDLVQFEAACQHMDVPRSETALPEDKTRILSEIKASSGIKSMQTAVQEALVLSVRSALRWRMGLRGTALYCGLTLQRGQFSLLNYAMHRVTGLEEEAKLESHIIHYLRRFLDEGNTDEISREVFTAALSETGFDKEEAQEIFSEISVSGEDIQLPAVAAWWKQHHEAARLRRPPEMTTGNVLGVLQGLQAHLGRNGLQDLATSIGAIANEQKEAKLLRRAKPLPPPELMGDWNAVSEEVSWRLHIRDLSAAVYALHPFLLANGDALSSDPMELPKPPTSGQLGISELRIMLPLFLGLFSNLLKTQQLGHNHPQSSYFSKVARELRNPGALEAMLATVPAGDGKARRSSRVDFDKQRVVRDMIHLKYGDERPVSEALIMEAEKSVVAFTANKKVAASSADASSNSIAPMSYVTSRGIRPEDEDKAELPRRARQPDVIAAIRRQSVAMDPDEMDVGLGYIRRASDTDGLNFPTTTTSSALPGGRRGNSLDLLSQPGGGGGRRGNSLDLLSQPALSSPSPVCGRRAGAAGLSLDLPPLSSTDEVSGRSTPTSASAAAAKGSGAMHHMRGTRSRRLEISLELQRGGSDPINDPSPLALPQLGSAATGGATGGQRQSLDTAVAPWLEPSPSLPAGAAHQSNIKIPSSFDQVRNRIRHTSQSYCPSEADDAVHSGGGRPSQGYEPSSSRATSNQPSSSGTDGGWAVTSNRRGIGGGVHLPQVGGGGLGASAAASVLSKAAQALNGGSGSGKGLGRCPSHDSRVGGDTIPDPSAGGGSSSFASRKAAAALGRGGRTTPSLDSYLAPPLSRSNVASALAGRDAAASPAPGGRTTPSGYNRS